LAHFSRNFFLPVRFDTRSARISSTSYSEPCSLGTVDARESASERFPASFISTSASIAARPAASAAFSPQREETEKEEKSEDANVVYDREDA
jgi:hypothetical protein